MELKDLLETLDLGTEVKDIEGFKKTFNEKFIPKSHIMEDEGVKKAIGEKTGKTMGAITTAFKRDFGLSSEDVEGKKWEDILALGLSKKKAEIDELKTTLGSGNDEKVTTLTSKLEKKDKDFNELKDLLDKTTQAVNTKDQELTKSKDEFNGQIKAFKINTIIDKTKEKVYQKFKGDISDAEKFYFESKFAENFNLDFDDKENIVVFNKSDGKRIQNPNKVGSFLDLEEAMLSQGATLNLAKKNNGAGVDLTKLFNKDQSNGGGGGNGNGNPATGRKLHPNASKAAEMAVKK